jgi:hypothetical protein
VNGKAGIFAVFIIAFFVLFIAFIIGWVEWWFAPIVVIGGFVILWGLLPRYHQPELRGEDKYHLHP